MLLLFWVVVEPLAFAKGIPLVTAELALTSSPAPELLLPILSKGRTEWHCQAELAASSEQWTDAQLPKQLTD